LTLKKLLLATGNKGKVREYKALLAGVPYEIVTPAEVGVSAAVEETGTTFEENARLKAVTLAKASGLLTLADDSGLEVDALGGEPGIRSSRYAGKDASDADRISFLLSKLTGVPEKERTARFRCVIAIAAPGGKIDFYEGVCPGLILTEQRGSQGFGYDPVFYLPDMGKTMAELTLDEKNRVSHRARAAAKARQALKRLSRST
jgi:XTP/dITP diphosphohydrolase